MLYMYAPINVIIDVETNRNIDDVVKRCKKLHLQLYINL